EQEQTKRGNWSNTPKIRGVRQWDGSGENVRVANTARILWSTDKESASILGGTLLSHRLPLSINEAPSTQPSGRYSNSSMHSTSSSCSSATLWSWLRQGISWGRDTTTTTGKPTGGNVEAIHQAQQLLAKENNTWMGISRGKLWTPYRIRYSSSY